AAREVIIGALGTIYSVADADENSLALRDHLKNARDARTGELVYSPLVALSLLVFFVLALQCTSTLAIAKRELNSWKWPTFMWVYMTTLAYIASLVVYQGGLALGF
ncbi:MAG: ferrous iron transport protein B, partial [Bacteroidetes bacterium]